MLDLEDCHCSRTEGRRACGRHRCRHRRRLARPTEGRFAATGSIPSGCIATWSRCLQGTECAVDRIVLPKASDAADITRCLDSASVRSSWSSGAPSRSSSMCRSNRRSGVVHCEAIAVCRSPSGGADIRSGRLRRVGRLSACWNRPGRSVGRGVRRTSLALSDEPDLDCGACGRGRVQSTDRLRHFATSTDCEHLRRRHARLATTASGVSIRIRSPVVNEVFTPIQRRGRARQARVRRISGGDRRAGIGAIAIGAEMIDAANLRMARRTLRIRRRIRGIAKRPDANALRALHLSL